MTTDETVPARDEFVLEIPEMVGIPLAAKRSAQTKTRDWPQGTYIVSADSHMIERDCWISRFPYRVLETFWRRGGSPKERSMDRTT